MIFITKNNIVEVANWALKGNELFSGEVPFHEILNPIFSVQNGKTDWESLYTNIEKQIKENKGYVDLRPLE